MNFKLPWYFSLAFIICWPAAVLADPVFSAEAGGIKITLYTEKCKLTEQVSNLPVRATWTENGKTFEGCVGSNPQLGLFIFYFEDKSAVAVPMQSFQRVVGA